MTFRWLKGAYLSVEGFVVGNIFRNEPFARDSLMLPLLAALFGLRRHRRALALVAAAFALHFVTVAWHAHGTYRYFLPFYAVIFIGAGAGIAEGWRRWVAPLRARRKTWVGVAAVCVFMLPLVRPMVHTLGQSDGALHREALEVVEWIERATRDDAVIMAFPTVEKYLYRYARPTIMTPHGPLDDVWHVVCSYGVDYLVVSAEQLRWLPTLRRHWVADGATVIEREPAPFLHLEMVTADGMFRVYRFDRKALCGR